MKTQRELFEAWSPRVLGVVRIVAGLLFMAHGTAKLFGRPHVAMFDGLPLLSLLGLAGALELVGGALVALGLFTRPVAFVLSGEMAVAYFMVHAPQGFLPLVNQGELAALYSFLFLHFTFTGAGSFSIDAIRGKA